MTATAIHVNAAPATAILASPVQNKSANAARVSPVRNQIVGSAAAFPNSVVVKCHPAAAAARIVAPVNALRVRARISVAASSGSARGRNVPRYGVHLVVQRVAAIHVLCVVASQSNRCNFS